MTEQVRQYRLLVVDDDRDSRVVLARLLQLEGYEVQAAAGVEEALRLCDERRFDLIVADIELGDGDGIDLLARIKTKCGTRGIVGERAPVG